MLDCLGGTSSWAPGYFQAPSGVDVFASFRSYVDGLSHALAHETDRTTLSLLAAARLLTGDWSAARVIADNLPTEIIKRDHGAGICLVVPFQALAAALPLPPPLQDLRRWLAGSPEGLALQDWLAKHGEHLQWIEATGVYVLIP